MTLIYTYYGQKERIPGILEEKHPDCRVIIVDDCSPEPLKSLESVEVYRIDTDIPWNQPGARNLGFSLSEGWVICADIDHLVTKENIDDLLKLDKEKGAIYYLGREDEPGWNLYLVHKDDFEKVGGYDEDFCGHYGYDDTLFNMMAKRKLKVVEVRNIKAKVFAKESSSKLERDTTFNRELLHSAMHYPSNHHDRLRFNWHKI